MGVSGNRLCLCDWVVPGRVEKTLKRIQKFLAETSGYDDEALPEASSGHDNEEVLDKTAAQLTEYFAGRRRTFDIPLLPSGTEFQRLVWEALNSVPYGETDTYKGVAERIKLGKGVRAVASAIGANPLSILIPCHRIIGAGGALTGYAGGLEAKEYLLALERRTVKDNS